jgi:hypothetical protein
MVPLVDKFSNGSIYKSEHRAIESSKKKKWCDGLREERRKDIEVERNN